MKKICAIAAMDEGRVIGKGGGLPWHLPEDMKHFKQLTMGHAVLMGRKTYESIPEKMRPLPGRRNLVLTSNPSSLPDLPSEVALFTSVKDAIESFKDGILWIIGGEKVYRETLQYWDELFLTLVKGRHEGDAFFPEFEGGFELRERERGEECSFLRYVRK